ncbi:MAG TPA: hypothetical protein VIO84_14160 [Candidatus Dormibacteraeota bacterium]|jgi:hypothetical protein
MGRWLAVIVPMLIAAACGGGSAGSDTPTSPAPAVSASPTGAVTARSIDLVVAPHAGRTINGTAHIDVKPAGGYSLTVTLHGLTPGAQQVVNIHAGTCGAEDTSVLINVGVVHSDAAGDGVVAADFPNPYLVPAGGRILTVHGPNGTNDALGHLACADMTA